VIRADLIFTRNGNQKFEEWFRTPATLLADGSATATLPEGTTHYLLNLIDENNFLISYPDVPDGVQMNKTKETFAPHAIAVR